MGVISLGVREFAGSVGRKAAVAFAAALLVAGCPDLEITSQPDQPGEQQTGGGEAAKKEAALGDAITLKGHDPQLLIKATVKEVLNPATPADDFSKPDAGNRFVAVRLQLENVGQKNYQDSPSNGAKLVTAGNEQFTDTFAEAKNCQSFAGGSVTLAPASTAVGCLVYELPKSANPASFQFTLESGFGPQTGIWQLGPGAAKSS